MEAEAAKYIGAGIAYRPCRCRYQHRNDLRQLSGRCLAQPVSGTKPVPEPAFGLRIGRGNRSFRSDYCPYFTVCGLSRPLGDLLVLETLGVNNAAA